MDGTILEINTIAKNNLSRKLFHFCVNTISIKTTLESFYLKINWTLRKAFKCEMNEG